MHPFDEREKSFLLLSFHHVLVTLSFVLCEDAVEC
jgi:hypothetical protein